jgi:hypothetical protein
LHLRRRKNVYRSGSDLFFGKTNIDYNKIIMSPQNNLIIVTASVKQCGAQMFIEVEVVLSVALLASFICGLFLVSEYLLCHP